MSNRLAASAYKNRVIEYLDKHLAGVAAKAFDLLKRKGVSLAFIGSVAALLHDIGKSLDPYQSCLINHGDACSYVAHEVFSAVMTHKLFEIFPDLIPDEVLRGLGKDFGIGRGDVVKIVMIPVLLHHQAMGDPLERLDRFIKRYSGRIEIGKELVYAIRVAVEEFSNEAGVKLSIELSEDHVNELERTINDFVYMRRNNPLKAVEVLRPPQDSDYSCTALVKLVTGVLIISDLHVARRSRRSIPFVDV